MLVAQRPIMEAEFAIVLVASGFLISAYLVSLLLPFLLFKGKWKSLALPGAIIPVAVFSIWFSGIPLNPTIRMGIVTALIVVTIYLFALSVLLVVASVVSSLRGRYRKSVTQPFQLNGKSD